MPSGGRVGRQVIMSHQPYVTRALEVDLEFDSLVDKLTEHARLVAVLGGNGARRGGNVRQLLLRVAHLWGEVHLRLQNLPHRLVALLRSGPQQLCFYGFFLTVARTVWFVERNVGKREERDEGEVERVISVASGAARR